MTSGRRPAAAAPITPLGMTQCAWTIDAPGVARDLSRATPSGDERQRRDGDGRERADRTSARSARGIAEDVQARHAARSGTDGSGRRLRDARRRHCGCHGATTCTSWPRAATPVAIGSMNVRDGISGKPGIRTGDHRRSSADSDCGRASRLPIAALEAQRGDLLRDQAEKKDEDAEHDEQDRRVGHV